MSPILRMQGTSVSYPGPGGPVPAVRDVDLELSEGQTLGLAGESGCGKTTLATSVLRLLPRSAVVDGRVLLDGRDVRTLSFGQMRAVRWASASVVFQGAMHALNPVRSVGSQIAEPIRLHSTGKRPSTADVRRRVERLLEQVQLPVARVDAYPHELSGGQKQRVMIAMALACDPRLVIADEPTTALDVVVQAQVLDLLGGLVAERGIALMMISHDLSVLSASCSRLAVMHRGRIVEQGPTRRVAAEPEHEHTRALMRAFPTIGDPECRYARAPAAEATSSTELVGAGAAPVAVDEEPVGGGEEPNSPGSEPLLEVQDLSVRFAGRGTVVRAVQGVDLQVGSDEVLALVGQSGSGKTTLARTLLGLQAPTAGSVRHRGRELPSSAAGLREHRRNVQLVLQDPTGALNPRHTAYEAVAEGLRIHGIADDERRRVAEALEAAELRPAEQFFARLPHELSGGQRQRVVIAGALVLQPQVLVADEPVASLDATVRGEILALLLRLRVERGLSTLVITHDLGLAWNIADRVAVMRRGRIVEIGDVERVLLDPQHDYTRTLLEAVPAIERADGG